MDILYGYCFIETTAGEDMDQKSTVYKIFPDDQCSIFVYIILLLSFLNLFLCYKTFLSIRLFPMLVATGSFSPERGLPVIFWVDFNNFKSIIMSALLYRKLWYSHF